MRSDTLRATLVAALVTLPTANALLADTASWTVGQGDVRVVCPMTVGGSFEAKTTSLAGTVGMAGAAPAAFTGSLVVDLRSLDTGIGLRNEHLRNEYLEVGKGEGFDQAVLSGIRLGDVDPATFQGPTPFTGTFLVHGIAKEIAGHAEIRREGTSVRVEATFPVLLPAHGIPKPRYLGVGVRDQVSVKVSFVATPAAAPEGGSR